MAQAAPFIASAAISAGASAAGGTSTGGAVKKSSTLTKEQKAVAKQLGSQIQGGLSTGAGDLGVPLFSPEEELAFKNILEQYQGFLKNYNLSDISAALKTQLSGQPAEEVSDVASTEYFQKSIAQPLWREFETKLLPSIQKAYKGFTTRRGVATGKATTDFAQVLSGELARVKLADLEAKRSMAENALARQAMALQYGSAVLSAPFQLSTAFSTLASSKQSRVLGEAQRKLPENNPWVQTALSYTGQNQTQFVQQPETLTDFGQFLNSWTAFNTAFGGLNSGANQASA